MRINRVEVKNWQAWEAPKLQLANDGTMPVIKNLRAFYEKFQEKRNALKFVLNHMVSSDSNKPRLLSDIILSFELYLAVTICPQETENELKNCDFSSVFTKSNYFPGILIELLIKEKDLPHLETLFHRFSTKTYLQCLALKEKSIISIIVATKSTKLLQNEKLKVFFFSALQEVSEIVIKKRIYLT